LKDNSRNISRETNGLQDWWALLVRYAFFRKDRCQQLTSIDLINPANKKEELVQKQCRHSRIRKSVAKIIKQISGRSKYRFEIDNLCPICGLLPEGDRMMEYVLTVWFTDSNVYEYCFRDRREKDCYTISDNTIQIFLNDSTLSYSMDIVSAASFGARIVVPDAPEVIEAERILSSKTRTDDKPSS